MKTNISEHEYYKLKNEIRDLRVKVEMYEQHIKYNHSNITILKKEIEGLKNILKNDFYVEVFKNGNDN